MTVRRGRDDAGVVTTKDNVESIVASVRSLTQREILVGIPQGSPPRRPEPGEPGEPLDNATIGYIMETGSPAANIPARPFLVPGVRAAQDRAAARLSKAAVAALEERQDVVQVSMDAAGLIAQTSVQAYITDGPHLPLAPATLRRRKSRKPPRMGERPLVDTGQLRRSISYVIRDTEES